MKNTTLLFDFISGEILEFPSEREQEIIRDKHNDYNDSYVVIGRDYLTEHNVWFIKSIDDTIVSRLYLEQRVLDYLMTGR